MQKYLQKILFVVALAVVPWVSQAQSLGEYPFSTGTDTACDGITSLPYTENFDGVVGTTSTSAATNNLPTCWYYYNTGTNTSYSGYPIVYNSASTAHSGTNALRFYTYIVAGTYSDQIAVMPQTDSTLLPVSGMQVTFWMRSTSTSYNSYVVVGVMSDPTDASTFVPVDTVRTYGSTAYLNYAVLFGHYAGPHGHVVFKVPQPASSYNALLIDDVVLDYMPTCPDVNNLTVTHIAADSISVAWLPMGNETQWLVSDGTNEYVANSASYTFVGLAHGTEYTFSVRALCSATGDTSGAVSVTAQTLCGTLAFLPYIDDLDSYVGSTTNVAPDNNLPTCWGYINHGTRNNYKGYPIIHNNGFARSGGNCIRYYAQFSGADSNHFAILPMTDSILYPVNTLKMSFYMRAGSTSGSYEARAIVGVITDPINVRTFVPIDTFSCNGVTTYSRYEVSFAEYDGFHGNLAIMFPKPPGSGISQNSGYVDDFVIEQIPDCLPAVNLTATNTTDSTADLTWTDNVGYTSWNVEYGVRGFIRGTGMVEVANDTNISLTGLTVNTAYDVYVTPNCSGNVPGVAFLTFRTACGTIDVLPYFEDFEGYNVGLANIVPPDCGIPCWHNLDNSTTSHCGYIGNPSTWIYGAHSGSRFLYYYYPPTGPAYPDWTLTVLPPVNTDLYPVNTLRVSFWVKMSENNAMGNVVIGVMTDPTDASTFVPVDTVTVSGLVYTMKEVSLDSYTGSGAYIAMRYVRNTSAITYYFVDDITVEEIPFCPPVEYMTLMGVDSTSLTVSWVEAGTATAWAVEYGVSGFTPGTGTGVMVRSLPFVITGLTQATSYDIYVTPECPSGNSLTRSATFRTTNSYIPVPFVCTFEDTVQNALWALENGANHNKWAIGTATSNGGTHSLYVSNDNGASHSYTTDIADAVDYAFIDITLNETGDYGYSFDWKCEGHNLYDYMRAALIPASEMLTASSSMPVGLTLGTMPSTWIPIDGGHMLNLNSAWQTRRDVAEIASPGAYHLAFIFRCDNMGGSQPPPAVDNITLTYSPCTRPDSVVLSNLTPTSVDFAWHEVGNATEWQYQLDEGTITTVYTTAASFTGLTSNSAHTFRVRAICGGGDTSFWRVYDFHTPCSYITIPYTQDFESAPAGSSTTHTFVPCWTHINNGIYYFGYPYINTTGMYNHTLGGSNGVYWYSSVTPSTYGDYQAIVLPPFDTTANIDSLQLSFWTRANSNLYVPVFIVGVMTDPDNIATFVAVDTITVTGMSWREVVIPLSTYTGDGRFVAIKSERSTDYWYANIDDVTLDYATSCFVPTIVEATHTTSSTITLDWVDISSALQWQVEYGPQGYTRGSSEGTLLTTAAHPFTVGGLDFLTQYDFYVRPICGAGDTARWGYPTTLMTAVCDNSLMAVTGYATSTGTSYRYPVNNYYNYSLSETIIDSAELGGEMDIEYISYYYDTTVAMTHKENCTIYFQPTTLSTFGSTSAAVALDTATAVKVYTGSLNCTKGWNYFLLDTVYHYDGAGNLLVIVDDNSSTYNSTSYVFKTQSCTGNKTLYYYSDSYNPDVMNPSSFAGYKYIDSSRVVMQLISCSTPICTVPEITGVNYTYESATITWTGEGTNYEVNIKEADATDWPATDIPVTGTSYTFTGLQPTTAYTFRVRQDCTADTLGYSEWVVDGFLTDSMPCLPPDSLNVIAVTNATATLDWVPVGDETMWEVHVWYGGSLDSVYTVSSHPAIVGGFTSSTTYQASVRSLCGSAHNIVGHWSAPINFTTAVCPDVTGLGTRDVTSSSVEICWDADPLAVSWIIEYGYQGFDLGTGTTIPTTLNYYTITGLQDDMQYDFRVRAICGADWQSEGWASVTVTTLPGVIPCGAPTDVNTVVSGNTATVSWTAGEGNLSFEIEYGPQGFSHGAGSLVSAASSPVTLPNLDYATDYDLYVRAACELGNYSEWSTVAGFTTDALGIDDVTTPACTIYPNPTSGTTTITVAGVIGKVRIAVVDMDGRELATETLNCTGDCAKTMEVDKLAQGAYFVRITSENANIVKKLIVR